MTVSATPLQTPRPPRLLIAEDEALLRQHLARELSRWWPQAELLPPAGDGVQAVSLGLAELPDVCFLDIRMPGLSGLEVAQALVEDWPAQGGRALPLLVFVTAFDQYAVQAFEAQAVDYLVKPVKSDRLQRCIERLQAQLAQREAAAHTGERADVAPASPSAPPVSPVLTDDMVASLRALLSAHRSPSGPDDHSPLEILQIGVGTTIQMVPVEEVLYFEAADKYVRVITAQHEHLIRLSLRELSARLDPQRFWQIHRGTLVAVRAIDKVIRSDDGKLRLSLHQRPDTLAVSRLYAHLFKSL